MSTHYSNKKISLCSNQSSLFSSYACPLVANWESRWSKRLWRREVNLVMMSCFEKVAFEQALSALNFGALRGPFSHAITSAISAAFWSSLSRWSLSELCRKSLASSSRWLPASSMSSMSSLLSWSKLWLLLLSLMLLTPLPPLMRFATSRKSSRKLSSMGRGRWKEFRLQKIWNFLRPSRFRESALHCAH